MEKSRILIAAATILVIAGAAYAGFSENRTPVEFFDGHGHEGGKTVGAPQHSGGLDRRGCHNASVPYHCHR